MTCFDAEIYGKGCVRKLFKLGQVFYFLYQKCSQTVVLRLTTFQKFPVTLAVTSTLFEIKSDHAVPSQT